MINYALKKQNKPKETGPRTWIAVILLAVFACLNIFSMLQESPTSDETPHLTAGYSYLLTGDYRLNPEHPPLIKLLAALPLLALNLDFNKDHPSWFKGEEWSFGEEFMYNNKTSVRTIIFLGRLPIVLIAVLLGLLVFKWSKELYGENAGLLALLFYVFSPNIIANSHLVTFDIGITFFTLLSLYGFYHFLIYPSNRNILFSGLALGLALSTKFSAINIFPMYLLLGLIYFIKEKKAVSLAKYLTAFCLLLLISVSVILIIYRITNIGHYFDGLKFISGIVSKTGMPAFLLGKYSSTGWWYYFIVAFLLKTQLPLTIFIIATLIYSIIKKKMTTREYFLLIPAALFFAVASIGKMQLGIRYILPVYPFIFILAGKIVNINAKKPLKYFCIALTLWYILSALIVFPHYLSYFNELSGGPKNGYKYLIDSNVDWGQDLPGLKKLLEKEGNPEIILSFFGSAAPGSYGIEYQDFYSYNASGRNEAHINSLYPVKELFAISANTLQCLFFSDKSTFNWLKKRTPVAFIGNSIFVYDITADAYTHLILGICYLNNRFTEKAEREFKRASIIAPDMAEPKQYLEIIDKQTGKSDNVR